MSSIVESIKSIRALVPRTTVQKQSISWKSRKDSAKKIAKETARVRAAEPEQEVEECQAALRTESTRVEEKEEELNETIALKSSAAEVSLPRQASTVENVGYRSSQAVQMTVCTLHSQTNAYYISLSERREIEMDHKIRFLDTSYIL